MIKKSKWTKKGETNPLSYIMEIAIGAHNKSNRLVRNKYCTLSELDDFVNRANAAWDAVCDWYFAGKQPIEFEASTVLQPMLKWNSDIEPYIQVKCGESKFRVNIPSSAEGLDEVQEKFGDYYLNDDISSSVRDWLDGDKTITFEPTQITEDDMRIEQETDLFVISQGKVWSVDSGESLADESSNESYIFTYKRGDYNNSKLEVEWCDGGTSQVLVCELIEDSHGFVNVDCLERCAVDCIGTEWLKRLEKLYRDGRSNLPDAVFDNIMETCGMTEERLQELCGEVTQTTHYNSYGVDSSKVPNTLLGSYPASGTILSQDKVRDPEKLANIVKNWNGKAVISWKYDGCAVRLHYKGLNFVRAESKGKARDVTALMKHVKGFPQQVTHGFPMVESWFKDKEWFVTGEVVARNACRSVAAGYLLRKDADSDKTRDIAYDLEFFAYDSNICEYIPENKMVSPLRLYSQMMNMLKTECHFNVVELCEFKGAEQFAGGFEDLEYPQEFDVDGLVVRLNDIAKYKSFGETAHHPKGSVAFKFEDTWYRTKPTLIYGKRGSTNVIKIIAKFNPIIIDGKVVKSAVWQPVGDWRFRFEYDSSLWNVDDGSCYAVKFMGEPLNPKEIEVCLRGKVIPQWRLVEEG